MAAPASATTILPATAMGEPINTSAPTRHASAFVAMKHWATTIAACSRLKSRWGWTMAREVGLPGVIRLLVSPIASAACVSAATFSTRLMICTACLVRPISQGSATPRCSGAMATHPAQPTAQVRCSGICACVIRCASIRLQWAAGAHPCTTAWPAMKYQIPISPRPACAGAALAGICSRSASVITICVAVASPIAVNGWSPAVRSRPSGTLARWRSSSRTPRPPAD